MYICTSVIPSFIFLLFKAKLPKIYLSGQCFGIGADGADANIAEITKNEPRFRKILGFKIKPWFEFSYV